MTRPLPAPTVPGAGNSRQRQQGDGMKRLALWLLRDERLYLHITCPHGTFVPIYLRHRPRMAPATCDGCGFRVKVTS